MSDALALMKEELGFREASPDDYDETITAALRSIIEELERLRKARSLAEDVY
jgi:hypothetical protein